MKSKPNPFLHMLLWGIGSGFILSLVYILLLFSFSPTSPSIIKSLLNPVLWQLSVVFGAIPGAILGALTGLNLWFVIKRKIQPPYSYGKVNQTRPEIYATTIALAVVASFMVIASYFSTMSLFFFIPPFVAGIVAAYASHRYTNLLINWNRNVGNVHRKAKDVMPDISRLEDRIAHGLGRDVVLDDGEALSEKHT